MTRADSSESPPAGTATPRWLRWLFSWRTLRRALLAIALLFTLAAAYLTFERVRGRRAWETYKKAAQAEGRWHDLASFAPAPVPEADNFAATPLLATLGGEHGPGRAAEIAERIEALSGNRQPTPRLGNVRWDLAQPVDLQAWREFWGAPDILEALKKFPEMDEIAEASRRPEARFRPWSSEIFRNATYQQVTLARLARLFELRALAALEQGRTEPAAADALTLLRLTRHLSSTPTLGFQLAALTTNGLAVQVIWEGLAAHRWSEAQLQAFQAELARLDFLGGSRRALEVEESLMTAALEQAASGQPSEFGDALALIGAPKLMGQYPSGWIYQNLLRYRKLIGEIVLPGYDLARRRLDPVAARAAESAQRTFAASPSPYTGLLGQFQPAFHFLLWQFAAGQVRTDEALVACALERFRLTHGKYPPTLADLTPSFLDNPPADVNTGEPLQYRPAGNGFVLYSIGMDGLDNGGVVFSKQGPFSDIGDWVWTYSPQDVVK